MAGLFRHKPWNAFKFLKYMVERKSQACKVCAIYLREVAHPAYYTLVKSVPLSCLIDIIDDLGKYLETKWKKVKNGLYTRSTFIAFNRLS